MAKYSVSGTSAATPPKNACAIYSTTGVRPKVYDAVLGAAAGGSVNDYEGQIQIKRMATVGSGGSSFTPLKLDPLTPAATCTARAGDTTIGTAGDVLVEWGQNLRATWRWVAAPGSELIANLASTAPDQGIALCLFSASTAFTIDGTLLWEE